MILKICLLTKELFTFPAFISGSHHSCLCHFYNFYSVEFLHYNLPQQPKEKGLHNSGLWNFKRKEHFERLITLVKREMEVKFAVAPSAIVSKTPTAALTSFLLLNSKARNHKV